MNITRLLIIAALTTSLLACGGAEDRVSSYMTKARESLAEGNLEKARINLKNVLQIDPKNAAGFFMLGEVFERKKDYRKAFANYTKAAELEPKAAEYQARIGKFYLLLANDADMAREKLDLIRQHDPDSLHGKMLEAALEGHEGNDSKALEIVLSVLDRDPNNVDAAIYASTLLSKNKKYDESIALLIKASETSPSDPSLIGNLARLYLIVEDYDKAELKLNTLRQMNPENASYDVSMAKFYLSTGRKDKAKLVLLSSIEDYPDDIVRRLQYVSFIEQIDSVEEAINAADEQIEQVNEDGLIRIKKAQLQLSLNDRESAMKTLQEAAAAYPDDQVGIRARLMMAGLYIEDKNIDEAEQQINEAYEISPNDSDVNMLKARIELHNKNIEQGIISLRNVIKDNPENLDAYLLLSAAHNANNEANQAQDVMARAHENNRGNLANLLKLSRVYLQKKDMEAAERVIDDYLRIDGENYDALSIKAAVLNSSGRSRDAITYARQLIDLHPEKANGYIQATPGLIEAGEIDDAIDLLASGLEKTGDDFNILTLLSRIYLMDNNMSAATNTVERYIADADDANAYLLLAKIYSDNDDATSAADVLDRALKKHPDNARLYVSRAQVYTVSGEKDKVKPLLERGVNHASNKSNLRLMLAGIYERDGDIDRAISSYRLILKDNPNNIVVMNNIAALIVESDPGNADIQEAMGYIEKIKDIDNPDVQDTVAWVFYHAGKYEEAASILERLLEANPDNVAYNYHYGMVLHAQNDDVNARRHLEKALDNNKSFTGRDEAQATLDKLG